MPKDTGTAPGSDGMLGTAAGMTASGSRRGRLEEVRTTRPRGDTTALLRWAGPLQIIERGRRGERLAGGGHTVTAGCCLVEHAMVAYHC